MLASGFDNKSANDSGVVIKKSGGFFICLDFTFCEVSPVLVSKLIERLSSFIGMEIFL